MTNVLTIKAADQEIEINSNKADYASALVRGILGVAPVVGPILAEAITSGIPNQKLDRVITFIKVFEDRIKYLEEDVLKEKLRSEEFGDLLEDALPQAARALSDERKEYIANLLKNSLTDDKLDHAGKKKLLTLLSALNDPEILLLYYYSMWRKEQKQVFDFLDRHPFINKIFHLSEPINPDRPEELLLYSYKAQLILHDLLIERNEPSSTQITGLGELLIKYIEPKS